MEYSMVRLLFLVCEQNMDIVPLIRNNTGDPFQTICMEKIPVYFWGNFTNGNPNRPYIEPRFQRRG